MALKSKGSILNRRSKDKQDCSENEKKITVTSSASNITSSVSPTTMRLPPKPKAELAIWISELQELTDKKITPAKLMRGLIEMRGEISSDALIEAIHKVT
ncbi:hypothetical protein O5P60_004786 [Vibrio parahaemolyticus]|nr:hypothetical protein [Vibrio parahaemolyticus]EKG9665902.1 hypothetical protein [Vibrio parahaemolyticus]EKG9671049.1 hypothetical protein [Vibrio parahaemolyticus]